MFSRLDNYIATAIELAFCSFFTSSDSFCKVMKSSSCCLNSINSYNFRILPPVLFLTNSSTFNFRHNCRGAIVQLPLVFRLQQTSFICHTDQNTFNSTFFCINSVIVCPINTQKYSKQENFALIQYLKMLLILNHSNSVKNTKLN